MDYYIIRRVSDKCKEKKIQVLQETNTDEASEHYHHSLKVCRALIRSENVIMKNKVQPEKVFRVHENQKQG